MSIRVLIPLALLIGSPLMAEENPYGELERPFDLQQAGDAPIWYVVGESGVPGPDNEGNTSNAGFVITTGGVVVYDGLGTPALGYRLLQAIRERSDLPVTHVIAGHYHADHIYGLQAFREHTDATVIAQADAADYYESAAAQERLAQRRESLYPWVDENTEIVVPDQTFADEMRFTVGDADFRLIDVGPAHSPSDVVMIVEPYNVVFAGDLLFGGRLPWLGGRINSGNWLAGLDLLRQLDPAPAFVIPGHGAPDVNGTEAIGFTGEYILKLRETMGEAVEELETFEDAYQAVDWSDYKDVPTFDAANRRNALQVFLELEQASF